LRFEELSYANERDPRLKRWLIRSIEGLSGRDRYVRLYDIWRSDIVGKSERVFGKMLDLIDVEVDVRAGGRWNAFRRVRSSSSPTIPSASATASPCWRLPSSSAARSAC
jgi:putative hemolysin